MPRSGGGEGCRCWRHWLGSRLVGQPRPLVHDHGSADRRGPRFLTDARCRSILRLFRPPVQGLLVRRHRDAQLVDRHAQTSGAEHGTLWHIPARGGKPVGPDLNDWINGLNLNKFKVAPVSWKGLRVHIAQRPDGLITVLPTTTGAVRCVGRKDLRAAPAGWCCSRSWG